VIEQFNGKNAFLSNFYEAPFEATTFFNLGNHDRLRFPTVEHWFQAHKASEFDTFEYIRTAPTPSEAKRRGRRIHPRQGWDQIREDVMRQGIFHKFNQNDELRQMLKDTGEEELQEGNHWGDVFWGRTKKEGEWQGFNRLGEMLMELREELLGG
jgi:ribA/ribD-fused uncharacterized protein